MANRYRIVKRKELKPYLESLTKEELVKLYLKSYGSRKAKENS